MESSKSPSHEHLTFHKRLKPPHSAGVRLVPKTRFELVRECSRYALNVVRLPVPPLRHGCTIVSYHMGGLNSNRQPLRCPHPAVSWPIPAMGISAVATTKASRINESTRVPGMPST